MRKSFLRDLSLVAMVLVVGLTVVYLQLQGVVARSRAAEQSRAMLTLLGEVGGEEPAGFFSHLSPGEGEVLLAVDQATGVVLAGSRQQDVGKTMGELGFPEDYPQRLGDGGFVQLQGERYFYLFQPSGELVLGRGVEEDRLYPEGAAPVYGFLPVLAAGGVLLVLALDRVFQRRVINGLHQLMGEVTQITGGESGVQVQVGGSPEWVQLSGAINQMAERISRENGKIAQIIELVDVPIAAFEYMEKGRSPVAATKQLPSILGMSENEANRLFHNRDEFWERLWAIQKNPEKGERDIYQLPNQERWVKMRIAKDRTGVFGALMDVTPEISERRKVQFERDHDSVTRLLNRKKFAASVAQLLGEEELDTAAMIALELDDFKELCDRFGREWGESYLRQAAEHLSRLGEERGLVARHSEGKFLVFLHGAGSREELLQRLQGLYVFLSGAPVELPDHTQRALALCAGVAWHGRDLATYDRLFSAADRALRQAKAQGRNTFSEFTL